MKDRRVATAEPYHFGGMSSTGRASGMLIRQFEFPDTYAADELYVSTDHDRILQQDRSHATRCLNQYGVNGPIGIQSWLGGSSDEDAMAFIIDYLKADPNVDWTGYRVLGTVHQISGNPIWSLELFAKHPKSDTTTYTGSNAPNVRNEPTVYGMMG